VETTREQVFRIVRGHRETTIAHLAEALGLSQAAVRRHLDVLRADGLVDVKLERHGVGRPALVFFVTERGEELAGRAYAHLLSRLVRQLETMDTDEVAASGRELLGRVFAGVAEDIAETHRFEVRGASLDERVAEVSHALQREGIVDGWQKDGDVYKLLNGDCPYLRLAEMNGLPCRSDREAIELLVGAKVEQVSRIVDGAAICEYIVRPEPVAFYEEREAKA
jgi:predicted ArsR family transcriptional regulator